MPITLKEFSISDLKQIAALDKMIELEGITFHGIPFTNNEREAQLEQRLTQGAYLITTSSNGELSGYLDYRKENAYVGNIHTVAVSPSYRRTSILGRLLGGLHETISMQGPPNRVCVCALIDNPAALQVHDRFGFRETGRIGDRIFKELDGHVFLEKIARYSLSANNVTILTS